MKADPRLVEQWRQQPAKSFRLIVRVSGDLDQADGNLRAKGVQVHRRNKLINGFAIEGTGEQAVALLEESWVISCELDAPVHAWPAS